MSGMAFSRLTGKSDHEAVQIVLRTDEYSVDEFLEAVRGLNTEQHRYTIFTRAYSAEDLISGAAEYFGIDREVIENSMNNPNTAVAVGSGSSGSREQLWETLGFSQPRL